MRRIVQWVVRNGPAINTLMAAVIVTGVWAMLNVRKELFPQFALELVTVSVEYPGASPAEVEEGICQKIEEAIRSIEGIKTVRAVAREGMGMVTAELYTSVDDPQRVVNEIRSEVDQIPSFPLLAEDPDIKLVSIRNPAIRLALYGGADPPDGLDEQALRRWRDREERQLRELAERVRDELLSLSSVSLVEMLAVKDYQIDIEIPEQTLRRYDLSLRQVADVVRRENIEVPAGEIKAASSEFLVRGKNKRLVGEEIAKLPVLSRPDGTILRVADLGTVRDAFTDEPMRSDIRFPSPRPAPEAAEIVRSPGSDGLSADGSPVPAMILMVQKTPTEDLLEIVDEVKEYVRNASLPAGYGLVAYDDQSVLVVERLETLAKNALQGLVLVFVVLSLFLELRLAFWVAMGIPVAVAGAFLVMFGTGQTINMVSTFAFLLALGIVVDDAIVIGENVYRHREMGKSPVRAAIDGTTEVATPVIASVTTTVFAFMPMFFVSGTLGKVIYIMPIVVISMLVSSLIESQIILPNHLSHVPEGHGPAPVDPERRRRPLFRLLSPLRLIQYAARHAVDLVQQAVERGLWWFVDRVYTPLLDGVLRNPFLFVSGTLAITIATFGLIAGGFVPFIVFPKFDANFLRASVQFPSGTPATVTDEVTRRMADAMADVHRRQAEATGKPPVLRIVRTTGYTESGGRGPQQETSSAGSNIGYVFVELVDGIHRTLSSDELAAAWREAVGPVAGAEELKFAAGDSGPSGKPIEFQLVGPDLDELDRVTEACKARLADYKGVFDIGDNAQPGKPELQIRVKPEAETLGIDTNELALTVRSTFYGEEVMRLQRGRHEVKLMVRYPEPERRTLASLDEVRVRVPQVGEVPIQEVAQIDVRRGYSSINRIDQKRSVTVTADLDETKTNAREIVRDLQETFLPILLADHPRVRVLWEGQEKEMQESVGSLMAGFVVAVFAMYVLLTAQFRSYLQPLFVLVIIPFGFVGAILGHLAMGLPLTLFSMFGLVALAGVVVNDSIVLIDFINARLHEGRPALEALREAGRQRFRPVLLTSLTTIAALLPLLTEKSLQVQVLIPMATSLAFGLMGATVWVLFLVPTIYVIYARYVVGLDPETGRLTTAVAEDQEEHEVFDPEDDRGGRTGDRSPVTTTGGAALGPAHASPDAPGRGGV